jgi:AcrR family transcriptional regulator
VNARRQAVREHILQTAADLFRERGYRATTLDHIAARLGMSKASLYKSFHAKEEMLAVISRRTIETFTRELALVLRSNLTPEEKLRRVVRDHVRFVIANRSFLTVFFSEEANLPARLARALAQQKDRYDKGVESLVVDGVKQGVFRDVPPRLVVFGLLGMLNWVYKWYNPRGRWGAEEISSAFLSLVEGGLLRRARGGPALGRQLSRLRRDLQMLARALDA